jgi:hypothetical protein
VTRNNTATFTTNTSGTTGSASQSVQECTPEDLQVTKNAVPGFTRTYNWSIDKSVDNSTPTGPSGTTVNVNYTVTVTQTGHTDSGWNAQGTITLTNPNDFFDFTGVNVTDAIDFGGDCTVTNGTGLTVPASGHITRSYNCTYASQPTYNQQGTNTATASWDQAAFNTPDALQTGTANFTFNDGTSGNPTEVNKCVTVTDSYDGPLGQDCVGTDPTPKQFTYQRTLTFPAGTCTTFPNTATIDQTKQNASASVKACGASDLTVSKTATASLNASITKSVDKTVVKQAGGTATFHYTVKVTESGWNVAGTITVTNPNDWEDITANVTDAIDNGGTCVVTGGTNVDVPEGSNVQLPYSCTYGSSPTKASGTNTATAAWNSATYFTADGSATGTAGYTFQTLHITDTYAGPLGTVTVPPGSATFTYARTVPVPADTCVTYPNTATIVETSQISSQSVQVCGAVAGGLTMGFWQNKNGQGIITGGASTGTVCNLGTWLFQFAPFQDLPHTSVLPYKSTATCAQVATYVFNVIKAATCSSTTNTCNTMLKSQMLATALDVYFSDPALGGDKIAAFNGGNTVSLGGVKVDLTQICAMDDSSSGGSCSGSFSGAGIAFGAPPNSTCQTVSQLLTYAASTSNAGGTSWYSQVKTTQVLAKNTFDSINNQVALSCSP